MKSLIKTPKRLLVILFIGVTALLIVPLRAQVKILSLDEAVTLALENNRELQISKLESEKNDQSVREAWGNAMPSISFSSNFTHSFQTAQFFPRSFGNPGATGFQGITLSGVNSANAGITLQQPLYRGVVYAAISAADIFATLSQKGVEATMAQTITDVKKSYYDVLIVQEQLKLIDQSIARYELALNDTRGLFRQGLASDLDTLRAYVALENLRPSRIKAETGIDIALTVLKTKIGISATDNISLSDSLQENGLQAPIAFEEAYATALSERPEVEQLKLQVDASEALIDAEFSNHLPTLDAFAQFQTLTLTDNFEFSKYNFISQYSLGIQLNVPIFNGFKTDAKVQKAEIEKKQSETRFENLKELIRAEVRVSLSGVQESRKRILSQLKTVQSAERSYEITRSRRQQGLVSLLEVSDAELALAQAKGNYLQAVYDFLIAKANLDKALGVATKFAKSESKK
ncbi:MAG: TolC family protein [Chloroherpetonaceae bacterium]|nr:TolC family protein [Chloroherpetonaceae bacterium]